MLVALLSLDVDLQMVSYLVHVSIGVLGFRRDVTAPLGLSRHCQIHT